MASDDDELEGSGGSGVSPADQIKSYVAYAKRSLARHKLLAGITFAVLATLTVVAVWVWPRTYTCVTVLAAQDNSVLGGEKAVDVLRGAAEVIQSHDNVTAVVDELGLVKSWEASLSPAQRLKHDIMAKIRGPLSDADKRDALIALVEARINVTPPGWLQTKLTVAVDWHEPKIAAQLANALDQSYLKARHRAEISSITEYIAILEGHAKSLRAEIQDLSTQAQRQRDEKLSELQAAATPAPSDPSPRPAAPAARPAAREKAPAEDLSELRAQLAQKEQEVKAMEAERQRRVSDAEATLNDLRSKYTPAHPLVVAAERRIATLASDSQQLLALRAEVASLTATLKAKSAPKEGAGAPGAARAGGAPPPSSGTPGASTVEPLPAEIMRLMQNDGEDLDPAVAAQFRTAVSKYATLRDKIGTARVDLDTAQAAFKHRYQIVVPAEAPSKPSKPKVPVILAAGLIASLLAGLLLAVLAELRTGRLVEVWQVHHLGIPLLGDMRWPPRTER